MMLLVDIIFAILAFINFNPLSVFVYSIISATIYLFLFSVQRMTSNSDIKLYTIISMTSIFLFTFIAFGPDFAINGTGLLPTFVFAFISYIYFFSRTRYNQFFQVIIINFVYAIIKVGLIFLLLCIIALMGMGSVYSLSNINIAFGYIHMNINKFFYTPCKLRKDLMYTNRKIIL